MREERSKERNDLVTKSQGSKNEEELGVRRYEKAGRKGAQRVQGERLLAEMPAKPFSSPWDMSPANPSLCKVRGRGPEMTHWLVLRLSVTMRPAREWGSNPEKSWLKKCG